MPLSVILPYRERYRSKKALAFVVSWLQACKAVGEVIIVEHSNIKTAYNLNTEYYHLPGDGLFHKTRAVNIGATKAKYDTLLIHDADTIPAPGYTDAIVEKIEGGLDTVHLGNEIRWLSEGITEKVLHKAMDPFTAPVWRMNSTFKGGSLGIRKDVFYQLGGMNESFVGHGGEDTAFYHIISGVTKFVQERRFNLVHLFHPKLFSNCNTKTRSAIAKKSIKERVEHNKKIFISRYGQLC